MIDIDYYQQLSIIGLSINYVWQSGSNTTAVISELTKEAENVSHWYKANLLHANRNESGMEAE